MMHAVKFAILNLFIVLYCTGAFIMCSPPSVCHDALVAAVKPAFNFLGLYQNFWMYGPDPPRVNTIRISADITFADGSHKEWQFPRLQDYKGDFYLHQSKHRYYQWKYYLYDPKRNYQLLPDAALYAARMNYTDAKNPPVRVALFKTVVETAYPMIDDGVVRTETLQEEVFFTYDIKPGEL